MRKPRISKKKTANKPPGPDQPAMTSGYPLDVSTPHNLPNRTPLCILALSLLVLAVFYPVLDNGFLNYDDYSYVTGNFHVQQGLSWDGIKWAFGTWWAANWHPLTWLSHMLDCQFFGLRPWGHHLTSLLLHAINTSLVFLVLRRMTKAFWPSLFVAALFGIHPMHVESVAWIAERKDVLSTLFWLSSLWAYARFVEESERRDARRRKFYALSLMFFALGLMSKPMLVTAPCLMLLLDYWPLHRWRKDHAGALVLEKLPFFLLAVVSSIVTFAAQKAIGAVMPTETLPAGNRIENALVAYAGYLGKLFYPANLAVIYPFRSQWTLGTVTFSCLLLAGVSLFIIVMRRRQPWLLVGWFWFIGTLVPVIGLVQVGSQAMADRYSYVPSIGLFMLLSWGATAWTKGWRHQTIALSSAAVIAVAACAGLAWRQAGYWKNNETLFRHAVAVTKDNFIACSNLGDCELAQGRTDEAIRLYQEAIKLKPNYAPTLSELGVALCKSGQLEEGIQELQLSLKLNPNSAEARDNLADALVRQGRVAEAVNEYKATIRLHPNDLPACDHLGVVLENAGRLDEALQLFEKAVKLSPANANAHNNLGSVLELQGRFDQAIVEFKETVRLNPHYAKAHFNLGIILKDRKRLDEAIGQFEEGLKWEPGSPPAHNELGLMLGQKEQWDEAISQFQEAIRLNPDYDEAKNNLNSALKMKAIPASP